MEIFVLLLWRHIKFPISSLHAKWLNQIVTLTFDPTF